MKLKYRLRTAYSFQQFCNDFRQEVGETLFAICNPNLVRGNEFEVFIPQGNSKRVMDTLNYGSCNSTLCNNQLI